MVGMVVTPLAMFPAWWVCPGFQLDMTPGRQCKAHFLRLSPSHSRKSGRAFLLLPLAVRNCKARSDTGRSMLILPRQICCTAIWLSCIAAEGILRRGGEEQLLIPHTYFSTCIKILHY